VAALTAKEVELMTELQNRDGLTTEVQAEFGDQIQNALECEMVIEALDRSSALLREVQAALARVKDGTYGLCLQCEETISASRLAAVPWASFCIHCQEQQDRNRANGFADRGFTNQ
jgi:DnaK suppressor protein